MAQPYIGQIIMFGGSFTIAGWAMCAGQLMPISENDALFTLIGTTYGGDGQETFGLPDLRGRVPVHMGQGPGISQSYQMGEAAGVEYVTLTTQQMASHNHTAQVLSGTAANSPNPAGNILADEFITNAQATCYAYTPLGGTQTTLATNAIGLTGGGQPHENRQQYLTLTFLISLFGVFPSQT